MRGQIVRCGMDGCRNVANQYIKNLDRFTEPGKAPLPSRLPVCQDHADYVVHYAVTHALQDAEVRTLLGLPPLQ